MLIITFPSIALFDTAYWSQVQILSMRAYSSLAAIIYKKSLRLSAQSRNDNATGKILNLIVVDCDKVKEAMTFIIFLWASPIHIGLTMYFIWQIIGPSVLVGNETFKTAKLTSIFTFAAHSFQLAIHSFFW